MSNEELYDLALAAINRLFSDTRVSKAETKANLDELLGEIRIMIESLGDTNDE